MNKRVYPNGGVNYTTGAVAAGDTTIAVYDASSFYTPAAGEEYTVRMGTELMLLTGVSGSNLTVTRAQGGTTAGTYSAGEVIFTVLSSDDLEYHTTFDQAGTRISRRRELNFIAGTNITLALTDNSTSARADLTISAAAGGAGTAPFPGIGNCVYPFTAPPTSSNWTWLNQGTYGAVSDVNSTVLLSVSQNVSNADNLRGLIRPLPNSGSNYTLNFGLNMALRTDNTTFGRLCLYDNGSGKAVFIGLTYNGSYAPKYLAAQFTNVTSNSGSNYWAEYCDPTAMRFMRLRDDGSGRYFGWSPDGVNFMERYVSSRTNFITPTHYGICLDCFAKDPNMVQYISLFHLSGTPGV